MSTPVKSVWEVDKPPILMSSAKVSPVPILIVLAAAPTPMFKVVAADPKERVVTVASNTVAVVVVEVISALVAPFTPKSSATITAVLLEVKVKFPETSSMVWETLSILAMIPEELTWNNSPVPIPTFPPSGFKINDRFKVVAIVPSPVKNRP